MSVSDLIRINYKAVFHLPLRFVSAWVSACVCVYVSACVRACVSVSRQKSSSQPKVVLFSPRTAWCNEILICPWLTLVLFCAEMQSEWLVYPQYPWQMAALLCLWSGMGVAVWVRVWSPCRGKVSLTPLSRPCLHFVWAHFTLMSTGSLMYPSPPKS